MSRYSLVYPLNRGADMDVGGAADLQTDIMRFMAILSLCLVAIFALVQSMPMTPQEPPVQTTPVTESESAAVVLKPPAVQTKAPVAIETLPMSQTAKAQEPQPVNAVQLTRPAWVPKYKTTSESSPVATETPKQQQVPAATTVDEQIGFTLRFESDAALARLVAANQIGVYAIAGDRAQRMTVSESRISFWDASVPAKFHEMEVSTVPATVIEALQRTGTGTQGTQWGVTLPGKLRSQLDGLMQQYEGGTLVIGANGAIQREAT